MTIMRCLDLCPHHQISLFAGQFAKYAEQGGAGHRLRHHRLRHCRRQHHGHGLLQDGQTAPDNLKLLSLQVIFKLHHWMELISVDIFQPSNSRLHHRRLFNPLLHDDPRHRKPKMAPQVFFSQILKSWLEVFSQVGSSATSGCRLITWRAMQAWWISWRSPLTGWESSRKEFQGWGGGV